MVYLLVESAFSDYPWCQRMLRGIYEEGRKKRVCIQEVTTPEEAEDTGSCILLAGASREWNLLMIRRSRAVGLHPVILGNQRRGTTGRPASKVTMDIHSSMELAVNYLHSLGRKKLALYGVNPPASSDPWRTERFLELAGTEQDVYPLNPTCEDCFRSFFPRIEEYDGVICASDYAAVSLVRRLLERGYDIPGKLYIVSYGDMHLSRITDPSITSISDDYESFGRAALSICSMVERNDTVSSVKVNISSRLIIRQTTENRPFCPEALTPLDTQLPRNDFFMDPEISELARIETLFNQFDATDFALLQLLMQGASYSAMAQQCFISETAAKYRLKKMKTLCGVDSRQELAAFLGRYL